MGAMYSRTVSDAQESSGQTRSRYSKTPTTSTRRHTRTMNSMMSAASEAGASLGSGVAAQADSTRYALTTYTTTGVFVFRPFTTVITTSVPVTRPNVGPLPDFTTSTPSSECGPLNCPGSDNSNSPSSTTSGRSGEGSTAVASAAAADGSSTAAAGALAGQSTTNRGSDGMSGGEIAAAVIVPIVVVAALILGIVFFLKRRKQRRASRASTAYDDTDDRPPMTQTEKRASAGAPNLNSILPGVLAKETEEPAVTRNNRYSSNSNGGLGRGPSTQQQNPNAPVGRDMSAPQLSENLVRPVSPIDRSSPPRDPFATPTPSSYLTNTPPDGPNFLAAGSTPRGTDGRVQQDELFMNQPRSSSPAAGRHWHSVNGTSRFGGRDPRQTFESSNRTESQVDDLSDMDDDDEDVQFEEAQTVIMAPQRNRASVIDMHQIGSGSNSPPKERRSGQVER